MCIWKSNSRIDYDSNFTTKRPLINVRLQNFGFGFDCELSFGFPVADHQQQLFCDFAGTCLASLVPFGCWFLS